MDEHCWCLSWGGVRGGSICSSLHSYGDCLRIVRPRNRFLLWSRVDWVLAEVVSA